MKKSHSVLAFALAALLSACGNGDTSPVPAGLAPSEAPKNLIEPNGAKTFDPQATGVTVTGSVAPVVVSGGSLDLVALKGTTFATSCYTFDPSKGYMKKYYAFGDGTINTLQLKYKDEACTQLSAPKEAYVVWNLKEITVESLTGDWSLLKAKVTCATPNCGKSSNVGLRVVSGSLHEASYYSDKKKYNTAEGDYLSYEKVVADLDKLSAEANIAAPATGAGSRPATNSTLSTDSGTLDLPSLKGSSWASNCYRFSDKGDYSKKRYVFGDGTIKTLLLKFKDDACTIVSPQDKPFAIWNLSGLSFESLSDNWTVVNAKVTCAPGKCDKVNVALRVTSNALQEGSFNSSLKVYNTGKDQFVSYSKATFDLDKLSAEANGNAPAAVPTTSNDPAAPVLSSEATGLAELALLATNTYSVCVIGKGNPAKTSTLQTLSFIKGNAANTDSYNSTATNFKTADCSGPGEALAPRSFSDLVVKASDIAGWVLIEARACTGEKCKPQKAIIQLTADGFKHAGEIFDSPGKFYTESPRDYKLVAP